MRLPPFRPFNKCCSVRDSRQAKWNSHNSRCRSLYIDSLALAAQYTVLVFPVAGMHGGGRGSQRGGCCFDSSPIVIAVTTPRYVRRRSHSTLARTRMYAYEFAPVCCLSFSWLSRPVCAEFQRRRHASPRAAARALLGTSTFGAHCSHASSADACQHERVCLVCMSARRTPRAPMFVCTSAFAWFA